MQPTNRETLVVFDFRDSNIDILRYYLNSCLWSNVSDCMDINVKVENFVATLGLLITMSRCIPARVVRLGRKDPPFISPLVRMLLNKRRGGKVLADEINISIQTKQSESLSKVTSQPARKWASVNSKYRTHDSHTQSISR